MRYSYQREVIKDVICSTTSHPTADWIYSQAKKRVSNISLGTVYRNLKTLVKIGSIRVIHDSNQVRYDGNIDGHHHLKCIICGILIDVDIQPLFNKKKIMDEYDFQPSDEKIFILGKCKKHNEQKTENKEL
tara:strand:+ start:261 stop:653 length:393 start_codon:yes stop_codon:yes gene_type:complete